MQVILLAVILSCGVFVSLVITIVCCYIRISNKKVQRQRSLYAEYSDQEPFVDGSVQTNDHVISLDPSHDSQLDLIDGEHLGVRFAPQTEPPLESPFKRIKSYTISGCSPRNANKYKMRTLSDDYTKDCNKNETALRTLADTITQENSIFDSFSKLKDIYDHQSTRFETDIPLHDDSAHLSDTQQPHGEGFDRAKYLYDRYKESMVPMDVQNSDEKLLDEKS